MMIIGTRMYKTTFRCCAGRARFQVRYESASSCRPRNKTKDTSGSCQASCDTWRCFVRTQSWKPACHEKRFWKGQFHENTCSDKKKLQHRKKTADNGVRGQWENSVCVCVCGQGQDSNVPHALSCFFPSHSPSPPTPRLIARFPAPVDCKQAGATCRPHCLRPGFYFNFKSPPWNTIRLAWKPAHNWWM